MPEDCTYLNDTHLLDGWEDPRNTTVGDCLIALMNHGLEMCWSCQQPLRHASAFGFDTVEQQQPHEDPVDDCSPDRCFVCEQPLPINTVPLETRATHLVAKEWHDFAVEDANHQPEADTVLSHQEAAKTQTTPAAPPKKSRKRKADLAFDKKFYIVPAECGSGVEVAKHLPEGRTMHTHQKAAKKQTTSAAPKKKSRKRKADLAFDKVYKEPTEHDCMMGRGGGSNKHKGNHRFHAHKLTLLDDYSRAESRFDKKRVAERLVALVEDNGGWFLEKDAENRGMWYRVEPKKARYKASQALREAVLVRKKKEDQEPGQEPSPKPGIVLSLDECMDDDRLPEQAEGLVSRKSRKTDQRG